MGTLNIQFTEHFLFFNKSAHLCTSWQTILLSYQTAIFILPCEKTKQKQNVFLGDNDKPMPTSYILAFPVWICKLDITIKIYV